MASDESAALTYASYLALDDVLGAQRPRSDEHDELLFIVIHQVYELWFKQLLHEFAYLQRRLEMGDSSRALGTLKRVLTILKTVVAQIDVLETMTPSQFASFRTRLDSASGFQSAQFRELEAILGRRDMNAADRYPPGSPPPIDASLLKVYWSETRAYRDEVAVEVLGAAGMLAGTDAPKNGYWQTQMLNRYWGTVGGGTSEVHRNMIGERALGLPAEPRVDRGAPFRTSWSASSRM